MQKAIFFYAIRYFMTLFGYVLLVSERKTYKIINLIFFWKILFIFHFVLCRFFFKKYFSHILFKVKKDIKLNSFLNWSNLFSRFVWVFINIEYFILLCWICKECCEQIMQFRLGFWIWNFLFQLNFSVLHHLNEML